MSHADGGATRGPSQSPGVLNRRAGAQWLVAHSAGEILALAALIMSAVALFVVLDDGDAPKSLRGQVGALLTWLEVQASLAAVLAFVVGLILAGVLTLLIRERNAATLRADRLASALGATRHQVERLRSALEGRDQRMLAVVHELRTPLTHVVGYAELLSTGARPRHPQEIDEMSAAIRRASMTMLRLMDDLVETTRAETAGFGLKPQPVDMAQLIRGVVAAYGAQDQGHQFALDLPDHRVLVLADPERMHQVLANLLSNAVSYSPAGGEIRVRARQDGCRVRVEIQDHGIGMVAEDQKHAFDLFYRGSAGRAVREHGSGLGLAIVRNLVEAHGGEVGVDSRPGEGSTFWFTLHAAVGRADALDDRVFAPEATPAARAGRAGVPFGLLPR